jgi:hypothetical protein
VKVEKQDEDDGNNPDKQEYVEPDMEKAKELDP